ncbi:MAG: MoxR family ATPase [Deltaproteobacteria bacterium]|nr:MoxR family ATPase [Deltaproteobacteria bacterium]
MNDYAKREYVGAGKDCQYKVLRDAWTKKEHYIASKDLAEAVNIALYLRRPLLLEGEPGCGKTRLAYSVAYELGYSLKECYIRSTSRAQDLLYTYDAVKRLYDIHEKKSNESSQIPPRKEYVTVGKLGEAIKLSQEDIPSVVLIDEIDKADIDFPNDLLLVLDQLWFEVDEVTEEKNGVKVALRYDALKEQERSDRKDFLPLIIVTSNREKELPKPFLRRCLFYYIEFPKEDDLRKIVKSHFPNRISTELFEAAIEQFLRFRQQKEFRWRKIPSTSELLDWIQILERDEQQKKLYVQDLLDVTSIKDLPHLGSLVKTQSDLEALSKLKIQHG